MRALIVGHGLIGKNLAHELLERDYEIVIIDPFYKGDSSINYNVLSVDLITYLSSDFEKFDVVVNTAYPAKRDRVMDNNSLEQVAQAIKDAGELYMSFFLNLEKLLKIDGSLIHCASMYGVTLPRPEIYEQGNRRTPPDYIFTKAGLIQLSKYFAKIYKKRFRINSISFGGVHNNHEDIFQKSYGQFTFSGKMLDVSKVTDAICHLIENDAYTGVNILLDDGFSL